MLINNMNIIKVGLVVMCLVLHTLFTPNMVYLLMTVSRNYQYTYNSTKNKQHIN